MSLDSRARPFDYAAMTFDAKARSAYIKAIEEGSGRIDAAHGQELDLATIDEAIASDPDFRRRLELAERLRVHDALLEAASSGNIPAIEGFLRRHDVPEKPPPAPSGALAAVGRLAVELAHLL